MVDSSKLKLLILGLYTTFLYEIIQLPQQEELAGGGGAGGVAGAVILPIAQKLEARLPFIM